MEMSSKQLNICTPSPGEKGGARDTDFGTGANRGCTGLDRLPWKEHLM